MFVKRGLKGFSKGSGISDGESNLPSANALSPKPLLTLGIVPRRVTLFRNNVPGAAYVARAFHGLAGVSGSRCDRHVKVKFRAFDALVNDSGRAR